MVQDYILRTHSQHIRPNETITHSTGYETCCCLCTFTCCPFCFRRMTVQTILSWWRTWRSVLFGWCWHLVDRNVRIINKVSHRQLHKTEPTKFITYLKHFIVRALSITEFLPIVRNSKEHVSETVSLSHRRRRVGDTSSVGFVRTFQMESRSWIIQNSVPCIWT